jgi:hypothetical protein
VSQTFLVECYWADRCEAAVRDRATQVAAVARDLCGEGRAITLLGAVLIADDEICFWRFASRSLATVEEAGRRAGLAVDRVMPSIDLATEQTTDDLIDTTDGSRH